MTTNWFALKGEKIQWLVHGLLANDSHSAIVGKPKSGKSTFIRTLAAAVIKGRDIIGRKVNVPYGGGKVLYVHLDRKDPLSDVAAELRQLGVTKEESQRLHLRSAEDMPEGKQERLAWLQGEAAGLNPHLIIIDLLFHFVSLQESNAYTQVLASINEMQDALREIKFKGHTATAHHQRKASNAIEPFDDILGSTGIRGSFATNLLLLHDRKHKRYTIQSDQTQRDKALGELQETVIERDPDTGLLYLGSTVCDLDMEVKREEANKDIERVDAYITKHPGCTQSDISTGLPMRRNTLTRALKELHCVLAIEGKGVANDFFRYRVELPTEKVQ